LIDSILKELKVIPGGKKLINDEDLFKIPEVYSGKGNFWVALENNKVVGTVALRNLDQGKAKLNRMFVLSEFRGTGLAQILLGTALDFAKKQGFKEIVLNTHPLMTRAHRFYEKSGFKKAGTLRDKYFYKLIF